ncbi:MAG: rhaB [Dactylosporangium sp.]|nr:rhaB [Dactylosporangium sp.]
MARYLAVDLGATSGRVMLGELGLGALRLREVHRFTNTPVREPDGTWFWNVDELYSQTLAGLAAAVSACATAGSQPAGIGIDSWGVDFGVVAGDGSLLLSPRHYRSASEAVRDGVLSRIGAGELFRRTGVQPMPINTLFQLADRLQGVAVPDGASILLTPDLWAYWLTGNRSAERTIASTSGLVDITAGRWDKGLLDIVGVDPSWLPPLCEPATLAGRTRPELRSVLGSDTEIPVFRVGSHDTASAVAAAPLRADSAFVSCGTWALVGIENDVPVLTEAALAAGFTNEVGVGGRTLVMRNLTGLWLLEQCLRSWSAQGQRPDLGQLLHLASRPSVAESFVDVGAQALVSTADVPEHIRRLCRDSGQRPPQTQAEFVRCILISLALAYRMTIRRAAELTGRAINSVHLLGGGARNALLTQLTADACELPVHAGPVEASSVGNIGAQAIAAGQLASVDDLRRLIGDGFGITSYLPGADPSQAVPWTRGERVLANLSN